MTLDYRQSVSVAEIVVYVPCLAIAIILAARHGFRRSSGWLFLIIFSLARIIGPAMLLATIKYPKNISLYTGSLILQNVGLSPLMLATLGLLSRALDSIRRSHNTFLNTQMLKLIEIVVIVGLILGIVGGINASDNISKGVFQPGSLSKAGTALFIVSYVATVIATIIISFSISHAEPGEKRLLFAVAVSLPLLLIRLFYSVMVTFTHNKRFNQLTGSVTYLLCLALIEEFIVVITYEGVGLTLSQIYQRPAFGNHQPVNSVASDEFAAPMVNQQRRSGGRGDMVKRIAKKTIIGRLVTAVTSNKPKRDVEMGTR